MNILPDVRPLEHGPEAESRVPGPIMTPTFMALGVVATIGFAIIAWRFLFGIGSVTALNDGYPWGIWIAFDVVVGTAIACGGYAMAVVVYVFNKGRYHPLVRSAILTAGLGYSLAGFAVVIDLGRFWNMWKLPIYFWNWHLTSILLEVALCIMLYSLVVWIELAPAFLQKAREEGRGRVRAIGERWTPRIEKVLPWLIALGVLLPTMHQSSLGSLMLLSGPKMHALWFTPFLPLLFLLTAFSIGFAGVVLEATLSSRAFGRKPPTELLRGLAKPTGWVMLAWAAIRVGDLILSGRIGAFGAFDGMSWLFLVETALFTGVGIGLLNPRWTRSNRKLVQMALLAVFAGALYRISVFLIAFNPGRGYSYFPAVSEILVTMGLLATEVMLFIALVKTFPILHGEGATARRRTSSPSATPQEA
jgi:Ni/Fe-hydrogenase subunit HybB-like protein